MSDCEIVLHPEEIQLFNSDGADAVSVGRSVSRPSSGAATPTSCSTATSLALRLPVSSPTQTPSQACPSAPPRLTLVRADAREMQPRWGLQYPLSGLISRDAVVTIQHRLGDLMARPREGEFGWTASQWMLNFLLEEVVADPDCVLEDLGFRRPPWGNCSRCSGAKLGQHVGRAAGCRFNEYNDNLMILCPVCLGLSTYRGEFKAHCRDCTGVTERAFRVLWLAARVRTGDERKQCTEPSCSHVTTIPAVGCVHRLLHCSRAAGGGLPPVTLPPLFQWQRDGECIAPPEEELKEVLEAIAGARFGSHAGSFDLRISQRQSFHPARHSLATWLRRHPCGPQLPGGALTLPRAPPVHLIPLPPGPPPARTLTPAMLGIPPPPTPPVSRQLASASPTTPDAPLLHQEPGNWPALIPAEHDSPAAKTRLQTLTSASTTSVARAVPVRLGSRGRPHHVSAVPMIPREASSSSSPSLPRDPRLVTGVAGASRTGSKRCRPITTDPLGQDDTGGEVKEPTSEDHVSSRPESPPPPPARAPVTLTSLLGAVPSYTGPLCTRVGTIIGRVGLSGQLITGRYEVRARDSETLHLQDPRAASWQAEARPAMDDPIPKDREKLHAHLYATRRTSGVYAGKLVLTSRLKRCNWFELRRVGDICDAPVRGVIMRLANDKE